MDAGPDELFVGDFHFGIAGLKIVDVPAGKDHERHDRNGRQRRAAFQVVLNPFGLAQRLGDWIAVRSHAVDQHLLTIVGHNAMTFQRLAPALGLNREYAVGADQQVIDVEGFVASFHGDVVNHFVTLSAELLQELAHGLFGGDSPVHQPSVLDGAQGRNRCGCQRNDGQGRQSIGIGRWETEMLGPGKCGYDGQHSG